jgi:6-phosphogluconolactonase
LSIDDMRIKHVATLSRDRRLTVIALAMTLASIVRSGHSNILAGSRDLGVTGKSPASLTLGGAGDVGTAQDIKSFLYVITNPDGPNSIAAYSRDPDTGDLSFVGAYATGGRGTGRSIDSQRPLVADVTGTHIYAVNAGSSDISVMNVRQDGSLELVGAPVPSGGISPASLALRNDLLYVANKGDSTTPASYSGFRVDSGEGLTPISRRVGLNVGDNPTQVLFSPDGRLLIGMRFGAGVLDCFRVRPSGKLRLLSTLGNQRGPFAAVFSPTVDSELILSDARLPGAASYSVQGDGQIAPISAVSNSPERGACWIAIQRDGSRAWVANTGTSSLSLYDVNTDGTVALVGSHSTAAFGRAPFEIALDSAGRFLYELNTAAGSQSIHAMRVTGGSADAGVGDAGTFDLPVGAAPAGLTLLEIQMQQP